MAKYKNIVGSGFPDYVKNQLQARQEIIKRSNRDSSTLQYLTNRNSFIRLSSGVLTKDSEGQFTNDLAKANILQGGTISINDINKVALKKGFSETYTKGVNDNLGYKPMPGITSLNIGTQGKFQTMLEANIEFLCYDLDQLDTISKLYMSLGCTVFLEWGHIPYFDNQQILQNIPLTLDFFNSGFTQRNQVITEINTLRKNSNGNYDALLGRITNFDFTANPDGTYSCKIQVLGPGQMVESLRINSFTNIDYDNTNSTEATKYSSVLENALISIKKYLENSNIATYKRDKIEYSSGGTGGKGVVTLEEGIYNFGIIDETNFFDKTLGKDNNTSYADLLNKIYGNCRYLGPRFNKESTGGIDYSNNNVAFGNAHQIKSGLVNNNDDLSRIPLDFYFGYSTLAHNQSLSSEDRNKIHSSYITLGHLMTLCQHVGIPTESPTNTSSNNNTTSPLVHIDYHPDNTIINRGPLEASIDPSVCVIPLSIAQIGENSKSDAYSFLQYLKPLNTALDKVEGKIKPNLLKNLFQFKDQNKVNKTINKEFEGKLFNILINLDFAINTLQNLSNSSNDTTVSLQGYIEAILEGINLSLGQVNNFRAFSDDNSGCIRIVDEISTELITEDNLLVIPNYGIQSLAYDYSFQSRVSPKLASQIVISTSSETSLQEFPDDVLSFKKLNGDIKDRFANTITTPQPKFNQNEEINKKPLQTFFDHLYNCYSDRSNELINSETTNSILNIYKELQNTKSKLLNTTYGTTIIPLEYSITIDGISGILPYNIFVVPNNRLPEKYKSKGRTNIAFAIYSINHNFNNNHWTTTLKGQTILLNKPFIVDTTGENPSVSENNSSINPSPPNNFNVPTTTIDGIPVENNASLNDLNFLRNHKSEIDLLKRAAQRRGVTTRQGISSIIAITAGESSLIPQNEFYKYNSNRLREVFTGLTEDQYIRSQQAILNNDRTGFFNIVYGEYEINRRRLGNQTIEDGGKYYGRGFIQLTGRFNYATLNPLVKDDIFNNPELANSPQTAAELAAAFIAVRIPEVQRSGEEFFNVAVQKVGGTEESKDLKRRYYNLLINNYEDLVGV